MDDRHWFDFHVQGDALGQLARRKHLANRPFKRLLAAHLLVELQQGHVLLLLLNVTGDLLVPAEGKAEEQADERADCEVVQREVDAAVADEGAQVGVLVIFVEGADEQEIDDDGGKRVGNLNVFFPVSFALLLLVLSRVACRIDCQKEIHEVGCSSGEGKDEGRTDVKGSHRYGGHRQQQTQLVLPPPNREKLKHRKVLEEVLGAPLEVPFLLLLIVSMLGGDMFFMNMQESHIILDG